VSTAVGKLEPDVYRTCPELIASRGFPVEEHVVTTEDGFKLRMFRISHGRHSSTVGPPVFLMHALLCSSDEWVMDSAEQSLAYVLADAGFDVWLGNKRGNTYALQHTNLSTKDVRFWHWTWDQVGLIDVPASIEYILAKTGAATVGYVGHSEGTTVGFIAATSSRVARKINSLAMLAPVANITALGNHGLLKWLVKMGEKTMYATMGRKEFLEQTPFLKKWGPEFCSLCPKCCQDILFMFCGFDDDTSNFNTSHFDVYYAHTPSGTSIENMGHWIQNVQTAMFRAFDYGSAAENEQHYGQRTPPDYDLSKLTQPLALFTGGKDPLGSPTNVASILKKVPSGALWHDEPQWSHMSHVWGLNAKDRIYSMVIAHLHKGIATAAKLSK